MWKIIPVQTPGVKLTNDWSPPKGKLVKCDLKEIDDVRGIFSQSAKEVFVPEAWKLCLWKVIIIKVDDVAAT